jgi:hypothetical protein
VKDVAGEKKQTAGFVYRGETGAVDQREAREGQSWKSRDGIEAAEGKARGRGVAAGARPALAAVAARERTSHHRPEDAENHEAQEKPCRVTTPHGPLYSTGSLPSFGNSAPLLLSCPCRFLEAGRKVALRLEYYEYRGAAMMRLLWQAREFLREVVPTDQLTP